MPYKTIYEASTQRLEILDKDGTADTSLLPEGADDLAIDMYKLMVTMRKYDEKALNLQRQGRMGTYGSLRGQEAAQAGLALAIDNNDWIVPSFREHGLLIHRGVPMHLLYAYWRGDERGNVYQPELKVLPTAVPVGSQFLHATGLGLAMKLKKEKSIVIGLGGDGATSEGDFHEALNMAGVFASRTLFFIQNNQWAISVPFSKQSASETLAQRAHAYGIPGIQVDGNDAFAVYVASKIGIEHVRSGKGPYLIEALTFRMENHTTADDHTRYRSAELVEYWLDRDPLKRLRNYLMEKELWGNDQEKKLLDVVSQQIENEVKALETMPEPSIDDIFTSMYKDIPWHLQEQRSQLAKEIQ